MEIRALLGILAGVIFAMLLALAGCSQAMGSDQADLTNMQSVQPNPAWLELAQRVHAKHNGQKNYVALIGDSITFTDAFWTPLEFTSPEDYLKNDGLPLTPDGKKWKDTLLGLRGKGMEHCNGSGWQVGHILRMIDQLMQREKPSIAIIMVGTNDVGSGKCPPGYDEQLERIVLKCLDYKCIPILNTIPPRHGKDEAVLEANKHIRALAKRKKLPLVDYYAEMTRRQPMEKMYETLMSKDGIHPSGGKYTDYSDDNLSKSGYALRNWMNFLMVREIYFRVLHPQEMEKLTKKE
ncbi:MAG: SGNH/GDSL hydrolase family protein [Phycisphaeraceae bacterium]